MRNIKLLFCYELEIFNVGNWISSHVVEWNTANEANCRECMHNRGGNHWSKTLLSNWTRAPLLSWLAPKVAKYRDIFGSGKKSWQRSIIEAKYVILCCRAVRQIMYTHVYHIVLSYTIQSSPQKPTTRSSKTTDSAMLGP